MPRHHPISPAREPRPTGHPPDPGSEATKRPTGKLQCPEHGVGPAQGLSPLDPLHSFLKLANPNCGEVRCSLLIWAVEHRIAGTAPHSCHPAAAEGAISIINKSGPHTFFFPGGNGNRLPAQSHLGRETSKKGMIPAIKKENRFHPVIWLSLQCSLLPENRPVFRF